MKPYQVVELNGGSVTIAPGAKVRGSLQADAATIWIGRGVVMNRSCVLRASEGASIIIGAGCLLSDVQIYSSDLHSILDAETGVRLNPAAPVVLEDRVWLGTGVVVLPGVTIGHDSVIGARSVVSSDIPPGVVAVGVPARVVREGVTWTRARV